MTRTLEEARKVVMELTDEDRQLLADEIIHARWAPAWQDAWAAEAERRYRRLESGEDPGLTHEEFWSDDEA